MRFKSRLNGKIFSDYHNNIILIIYILIIIFKTCIFYLNKFFSLVNLELIANTGEIRYDVILKFLFKLKRGNNVFWLINNVSKQISYYFSVLLFLCFDTFY